MSTLVVTQTELRSCLPLDMRSLEAVEEAFSWIAQGRVSMPPVMHIDVDPDSAVDIKGAYVEGIDQIAVKIATGFVRNPDAGLPSSSSAIALINAANGFFDAMFLDNGYLMDLRTGLAGGVAAKHLAPVDVDTVGVVGTGAQARYQIESLALVRPFRRLLAFGRNRERVARYCSDMTATLGVPVTPADSLEDLTRASQVIVTTTHATSPLIRAEWVQPGTHITAMGSDLPGKQELDPALLQSADQVVCDSIPQCRIGGELQHADETKMKQPAVHLGAYTSGRSELARAPEAITVCDQTGTGAQDTAIGVAAFKRIKAAGLGRMIG